MHYASVKNVMCNEDLLCKRLVKVIQKEVNANALKRTPHLISLCCHKS